MEIVVDTLKNRYAQFTGRARRKEYWMYMLAYALVYVALMVISSVSETIGGLLMLVFALGLLIPSLALGFRRLHDIDKSAWWLLIGLIPIIGGLVLLYFAVLPGTVGPNRFGPDPKQASGNVAATFA